MKTKTILLLTMLFLILLAACNPASEQEASPTEVVEPTGETAVEQENEDGCANFPAEANALIDAAHGICFLYPEQYDVTQSEEDGSITLYVKSPLNTEAPLFIVEFEAANGRSLEDVTAEFLAAYALPEGGTQEMSIGGEPAVMIDNLPGQDINRRVITIHNDFVYHLTVYRIGSDYGVVGEEAEALFDEITGSVEFSAVTPGAPLVAGPECPRQVEASLIYTNEPAGYCLLLPADYQVLEVSTEEDNNEIAFYIGQIQDPSHPRLWVKVTDANGATLEEATANIAGEFEGFDLIPSFGYMVDGVPANQFDQLPGQDLSRQVVLIHNDRLYTLTFTPDDPEAGDVYSAMVTMYEMVMDSFSFLQS